MAIHSNMARQALLGLYDAQQELAEEFGRLACGPGCAACCTDQALMTTLEAEVLLEALEQAGRGNLAAGPGSPSGIEAPPSMNALARQCLARQEPAAAPGPGIGGKACPLLADGLCTVYEARPLACRVMYSRQVCAPGGEALQDPWWITLSGALFQLAEQAAAGGGFGYLPQTLAAAKSGAVAGLSPCENLPGIVAPPEHQERLRSTLLRVFKREVDRVPLGALLDQIRSFTT